MNHPNKIEAYFEQEHTFKEGLLALRKVFCETELTETFKWNSPVYTLDGKNVAGLARFKNHFGVWFFNGALLKDTENKLHNAQEGKTKALRQLRYQKLSDIDFVQLNTFLAEAISNQKQGKEIKPAPAVQKVTVPDELKQAFTTHPGLEAAFHNLSLAKQRDYAEHISGAKQEQTRLRRLENSIPMICKGMGLNDKYLK